MSMFAIGICSTSAAICESDVMWPCPWLIEPEKIVARPLESMLTRALSQPPRSKPLVANRHGIGDDNAGSGFVIVDLVGAGTEIDGVYRWTAARHVGEIGADIAERCHFQAKDSAIVLESDLNILGMGTTVAGRLMAFGAA